MVLHHFAANGAVLEHFRVELMAAIRQDTVSIYCT
jgi:hypothetical protein